MKNPNEAPEVQIIKEDHSYELMLVIGIILLLIVLVWACTRSIGVAPPISISEVVSQLES